MPLPIGPIVGAAVRAVATKVGQRGAISAAQFSGRTRMGGVIGKSKMGTFGRGALLGAMFSGGSSGSGSSGLSSNPEQTGGTSQKQGLDTYGDGAY